MLCRSGVGESAGFCVCEEAAREFLSGFGECCYGCSECEVETGERGCESIRSGRQSDGEAWVG